MAYRIVRVSSRCKLETQLNYLVCRGDKEVRILLDEISVLIVENTQVCLTASLVSELLSHKTRIVFCDNSHNPQGEVAPYEGCFDASSKLRTQLAWSRERMDFVWKHIVEAKIKNQLACLLRRRPNESSRIDLLRSYLDSVDPGDRSNREGQAARTYFAALFGEDFTRGDPFDSRNSYLNYGYSVLLSLFNREIAALGYSNLLGIHHAGPNNPFNLGCDFVEPFRPFLDDFVASSKLDPDNFKNDILSCFTLECSCGGRTMIIQNAVNSWCLSVLSALNGDSFKDLIDIGFKDGGVTL